MRIENKIKSIFTYILLGLWVPMLSFSQDFHLSQYEASPQYLNPAQTGIYFGEKIGHRFSSNYRTQWSSVIKQPYVTGTLSYDQPYKRFGFGGYIVENRAGSISFNSMNVMLSAAYRIIEHDDHKHHLSVGLQMGLLQRGYNMNGYTFDAQYQPSMGNFDNNLPNNENFNAINIFKYDAAIGVYYKNTDSTNKYRPFGGVSIFHVTMPGQSFTDVKKRLPMRFVLNGGMEYDINKQWMYNPSLLCMYQGQATEYVLNNYVYYQLKDSSDFKPMLGLGYRFKDALLFHAGLKHGSNVYRISYDINVSSLRNYSSGRGAFEISVLYILKARPPKTAARM